MVEGKKWYYFSRRSANRVTANGYWKSCGGDEEIMSSNGGKRIGVKKYYVFHVGEGMKTDWTMQEFRVLDGAANSSISRRRDNSKIVSHHFFIRCINFQKFSFEELIIHLYKMW